MVGVRWDNGLLRSLGQALTAVLVAATFVLFPQQTPQAQASAVLADGSNSVVDYAADALSNSFYVSSGTSLQAGPTLTFEAWVKPRSLMTDPFDHVLVAKHHDYAIAVNSGEWVYWAGDGAGWGGRIFSGVSVSPESWVHISLVLDGSNAFFFVNAQEAHSTNSRTVTNESTQVFSLGDWNQGVGRFDAEIDEVRVWSTSRTAQLASAMHTRVDPNDPDLLAYWDFNEGSGAIIHDRTGKYDLTVRSEPDFLDVKQTTAADDGDTIITFPRTYLPGVGGWTVPEDAADFRALVVAGGGAGGSSFAGQGGGGGGAGGLIEESVQLLAATTVSVNVGQGGIRNAQTYTVSNDPNYYLAEPGHSGQNSVFQNLTALGGGGGGGRFTPGLQGGSSGGGGGRFDQTSAQSLDSSQGNAGGAVTRGTNFDQGGGGGGGAGTAGGDVDASSAPAQSGGSGGAGVTSTILSGTFAKGGDGGDGGLSDTPGAAGTANTGNGGGGASVDALVQGNLVGVLGGDGASGVIAVRYTPSIDQSARFAAASTISADYIGTSSSVVPDGDFTVEAWVKREETATDMAVFSQGIAGDRIFIFIKPSGEPRLAWGSSTDQRLDGVNIPAESWTHVALTRESGTPKFYVDSQLVWTGAANSGVYAGAFRLAEYSPTGEFDYAGEIDQVKIWSTALDESDLAKSMHTYSTSGVSVAANLVSHYDINDPDGSLELDRSGNGNHLLRNALASDAITSSSIVETGNATNQDVYFKFNRSYLTALGGWTVPGGITSAEVLAVAGGGAGGTRHGGGGGAGELALGENYSLTPGSAMRIVVGMGGVGNPATNSYLVGNQGQTTSFGVTSLRGGGGGNFGFGGSGGGGNSNTPASLVGTSITNSDNSEIRFFGNIGGIALEDAVPDTDSDWAGGGGGGAGGVGGNSVGVSVTERISGAGGAGTSSAITGTLTCYAAGGSGGSGYDNKGSGLPGSCVGAASSAGVGGNSSSQVATSALPNSGSGGGGGGYQISSNWQTGSGGSGVVILSYSLAPDAPTSLVATQTTTHATIDLSWTAPTYTGNSSITGYDIEYKPVGGSWTSHSSVASSPASVQLPQQCIANEFRVIAKNTNFSSVASATASATPVWGTFGSLTGVQISSTNSECVVKFTSTASATTWTPPAGTDTVRALVVGGGGGGGAWVGAGGGAGGFTESNNLVVPGSALTIEVGGGGTGGTRVSNASAPATNGFPSSISALGQPLLSALGGGAGASWENLAHGAGSGGSGGGGNGTFTAGLGADGQGFQGGRGDTTTLNTQYSTGGGGGAGGPGEDGIVGYSGDGGPGKASDITGVSAYYAGGGGGGYHGDNDSDPGPVYHPDSAGSGGIGGGGDGGQPTSSGAASTAYASADPVIGQNGQANTGGGGGGAGKNGGQNSYGGSGGSGVIILRQLSIGTPAISAQPQDASAEPGQTETLTVTATGNGTLSYQWQSSTDGTSWTNVGTNSSAFTTGTLALSDNGIQYRVVVTNTLNNQTSVVTSSVAVISVVGVTIGTGLCETMVSIDSGATVSQTAAGGCLLEFTTPGNNMWFVPNNVSSVEALVVGGGGGGASGRGGTWYGGGGGGGGGEYQKVTLPVTTSQQIPLTVGAGGTGGAFASPGSVNNGGNGQDSSFSVSSAVATGGSGGLGSTNLSTGGTGGSGGSGAGVIGSSGGKGSDGMAFQTYQRPANGSAANLTTLGAEQFCLGGGGAGGNRGAEAAHFYYRALGGDCTSAGLSSGGDGNYFNGTNYVAADAGVANTGGGGGGGSYNSGGGFAGAAGGSGLVALYYVPGAGEITLSQPDAMSYSSTANTASITLTKTSPGSAAWTTSNQTICTVTGNDSGATVTVLVAGVCAVSVTVAASGGFSSGSAEVSFRIDKITQAAPTWDPSPAEATVAFGDTLDLYEKLSTSASVANYSFTATGTGCAVTGVMLTVGDAGLSCSVTPTINGTDIYLPATGTALTVSVTKISQSALVLTSATSMDVDQTLTLSAAGGSGDGALSYIVANQGTTGCVANPTTGALTATGAGQCEVYAKRASSTNYDEVTSSHVVITVNKISQNLSWVSQPQAQYVAGNTYALEATASSQLAVAYSISSGLCTLAGSTVTFTGSGDCVIEAGQPGDNSFLPAVTISQTVSVGKINQTMTFSALANVSWGSLAFSLSATASSGLNIVYSENNQTTNDACDVSANGIVTIKHVGTCAITATQAGDSAYTAVTTTRLFEVTANQAGAPFIGSVSFGDRQLNASFFTPSYLGGGTVSAYELQAHPLGGGAVVKNTGCIPQQGPNQTCSVVGLTNGVTYELKVAAITQAGLGQLSASSSEVTPAANPEAVGNLVAIEGNGTLTLQWTPPTNLGGGSFDQYRIFWKEPGGSYQPNGSPGATVGFQASTSFVITGLTNGTAYDVKVTTITSVNTLELQSNTAEVRQTPYTVPDAPAAVVAIDNDNNVVVAWQAPVFDGGNPIDQYVVEKDGSAVCTITSATTTSCEVAKPSPGNTSVIEVRAGNDAGLSAPVSTSITVAALQASNPPGLIGGGSFPGVTPGVVAPIVLDVSGSAVVKTNELIRLVGTNLNLVEKVLIGDVEASFFVNSAELITIRIPVDVAAGNPAITLQGAFGSSIFTDLVEVSVTLVSIETKVTIGTFLGFAAVYTKNHEGKRLSMKIGNKWRVIDPLKANYTYNFTKVGVGKTVTVQVYLDRELVQVKQIKIK